MGGGGAWSEWARGRRLALPGAELLNSLINRLDQTGQVFWGNNYPKSEVDL